jgi:hypothetical protein
VTGRGYVNRSKGYLRVSKDEPPMIHFAKDFAYDMAKKAESYYNAMGVDDAEVVVMKRNVKTVVSEWEVD